MATIKVTYNSISRRFNITSTNWAELESKLRSLYNIPITSSIIASYNDEDGDVITLSSDLELKDVLAQQSSGKPIKLVLSTIDNKSENLIVEDENENDIVKNKSSNVDVSDNLIEDFSSPQQQQTTEFEEENVESRPPSYYQHVTFNEEEEEPEYSQSTPLLNKEKEKGTEKQQSERTNENKEQQEKENKENEDDEDDEIIFIISHPWVRHAFFGPRFGFFGGPRFGLFGGPRYCPFSPFSFYRHPSFFNGYSGPSSYYFSSRQCGPNAKSNACNGNSKPSCCSKPQQSDFCNKNAETSTSASAKSNGCNKNRYNYSSRPFCGRNSNFFHHQTTLTQEQLNDKLSTLHSMGFDSSNNSLYEDLLKRYNGNIERVIELLLRNQQANEYYDNDKASTSESKKRNGIVINEEKSNKQVDNEENKPYNL